jgi:hypothetical protein
MLKFHQYKIQFNVWIDFRKTTEGDLTRDSKYINHKRKSINNVVKVIRQKHSAMSNFHFDQSSI